MINIAIVNPNPEAPTLLNPNAKTFIPENDIVELNNVSIVNYLLDNPISLALNSPSTTGGIRSVELNPYAESFCGISDQIIEQRSVPSTAMENSDSVPSDIDESFPECVTLDTPNISSSDDQNISDPKSHSLATSRLPREEAL